MSDLVGKDILDMKYYWWTKKEIRGVPVVPILGLGSVALMMTQLPAFAVAVGTAAWAIGLAAGWLLRSRAGVS